MRGNRTATTNAIATGRRNHTQNHNHYKRNRIQTKTPRNNNNANHRRLWRLLWTAIFAGGFSFFFVVPLLHEGNPNFNRNSNRASRLGFSVHGFVTSQQKPQPQKQSRQNGFLSTTTTTTMAERKEPSNNMNNMPTDEESPNEDTKFSSWNSKSPQPQQPEMIFYQPSNPLDFQTFDYASNPTVFGSILRGELPTRFLKETQDCIAFQDISPRAPFHGLVIPKLWIPSVFELGSSRDTTAGTDTTADTTADVEHSNVSVALSLLHQLSETAHALVKERHPQAYQTGDYILCFHLPPFNSVDHLHLHVLAPASAMLPIYRYGKYNTGDADGDHTSNHPSNNFGVRWCKSLEAVTTNLQKGLPPAMPYQRDDGWGTILSDLFQSVQSILVSSRGGGDR